MEENQKIKRLIDILIRDVDTYSLEEIDEIDQLKKEVLPVIDDDYADFINSKLLYSKVEIKPEEPFDLPF
jgi:hypothetical protein